MMTWVEINLKNIEFNIKSIKKNLGEGVEFMPVTKGNAYGHGLFEISSLCENLKEVDKICVVNSDEAFVLKQKNVKKPLLILSFFDTEDKKKLLFLAKNDCIFPIYSQKNAEILNKTGESVNKKVKIHLKVDTGACRTGLNPEEIVLLAENIRKNLKFLDLEGIFSHFSSSEENKQYTEKQNKIFTETITELKKRGFNLKTKHIACSAAGILYPETRFNASRAGLSVYGHHPSKQTEKKINLKPALTWKTKIIQIKEVKKGTAIGYGGTFVTKNDSKIAVLPVGYWDGFDRRLSNRGTVLIKGESFPIVGRICMNLCMIDITSASEKINVGDTTILLGKSGQKEITAEEMAEKCDTISYEILDRINPLLPRIYR